MTTTYDLSTNIGKIRLTIGDKDTDDAVFTDEELQVFLTETGSVNLASALALEAWAASYLANVDSEKIGDYCLPTTAEALSREGWKRYDQLEIGEEILGFDRNIDTLKWTKVLGIHKVSFNGQMLKLESGQSHITFSTLASPNHRWYVKPLYHCAKWKSRIHKSTELNTWDRIPLSAPYDDGSIQPQWPDEFVECVGWFVTEGNFQNGRGKRYSAFINQSGTKSPENCQRIRQCLAKLLDDPPPEHKHGKGNIGFYIGARTELYKQLCLVCPQKQLTMAFLNTLTAKQMKLLWEVMILGDGDKSRSRFYQKRNETMEVFQALSVLCGYGTYLTKKDKNKIDNDAVFSLSCLTKIYRGIKGLWKGWIDYVGDIWCPNTNLGTWLVKDNGFTFITGNSYSQKIVDKMLSLAKHLRETVAEAPALTWAEMDLTGEDE